MLISRSRSDYNTLIKHIIFWAVFITYEVVVAYSFGGRLSPFIDYFLHYALNISLFYATAFFVLTPLSGKAKAKALLYTLLRLLTIFACYIVIKRGIEYFLLYSGVYHVAHIPGLSMFVIQGLWRFLYFIGIAAAYWFALSEIRQGEIIAAMEKEQLRTQLHMQALEKNLLLSQNSYLQAQINPHFLFNALNFVHHQIYRLSEQAGETVTLLADMMRYTMSDSPDGVFVPLAAEIEHIENYIRINHYRFDGGLSVSFSSAGPADEVKIIPLLLITIMENVFKYGELREKATPAIITIHCTLEKICLRVSNRKKASRPDSGNGIGLSNVRKRLLLHYPNKHSLEIQETENDYMLSLQIIPLK